jgi:hypothetical protein
MKKTKLQISLILSKALLTYIKRKPLLLGVFILSAVGCLWNATSSSFPGVYPEVNEIAGTVLPTNTVSPAEDLKQYLRDRPFIDSFPVDPRKTYKIYIFGKDDMGVFITAVNFRQIIEIFTYKVSGDTVSFNFLNADIKGKSPYRIIPCDGPGTFDISLELDKDIKNGNQKGVYYSSKKIKTPSDNHLFLHFIESFN